MPIKCVCPTSTRLNKSRLLLDQPTDQPLLTRTQHSPSGSGLGQQVWGQYLAAPLNITRPPVGPVLTYDVSTQRPGCDVERLKRDRRHLRTRQRSSFYVFLKSPIAIPAPGCCRVVYRRNSYTTTVKVVALTFILALYFSGVMFM